MKRFLTVLLAVMTVFTLASAEVAGQEKIDLEKVFQEMEIEELEETGSLLQGILNEKKVANAVLSLSPAENVIPVGKTAKLTIACDERVITAKTKVDYESSDETVATVKAGTVTGKGAGKATIKAVAVFEDGATLEAASTVEVIVPVKTVKAGSQKLTVLAGREVDVSTMITIAPDNATEKGLFYASDDESVATIDSKGLLKGLKAGKANITVTSAEEAKTPASAKIVVTVTQAVTALRLNVSSFDLGNGNKRKLVATVLPSEATDKTVTWESKNPSIATVQRDGTVAGVGTGTTQIVCTANDGSGVTASASVTVITAVSRLTTDTKELVLFSGENRTIRTTIVPSKPTNGKLRWSSSNRSVAEVSETGKVTAKTAGQCTVTASTTDGTNISISIPVYVEPTNPVDIEYIHWQTTWGQKNGKMGIGFTNLCSKKTIKSVSCIIECTSWMGGKSTDWETYTLTVKPGSYGKTKLSEYSVSGFSTASKVSITITNVTFNDGTQYAIPSGSQSTATFGM